MQTGFIAASHDVVFVVYKVVVEMDVMRPHLSVIGEVDLCPIVDMTSNGAVIDCVTIRGIKRASWVECFVDQDFARLGEFCESGRRG